MLIELNNVKYGNTVSYITKQWFWVFSVTQEEEAECNVTVTPYSVLRSYDVMLDSYT